MYQKVNQTVRRVFSDLGSSVRQFVDNHSSYVPGGMSGRRALQMGLGLTAATIVAEGAEVDLQKRVSDEASRRDIPGHVQVVDPQLTKWEQQRALADGKYKKVQELLGRGTLSYSDRVKLERTGKRLEGIMGALDSRIETYRLDQQTREMEASTGYEGGSEPTGDAPYAAPPVAAVLPKPKPKAVVVKKPVVTGPAGPDPEPEGDSGDKPDYVTAPEPPLVTAPVAPLMRGPAPKRKEPVVPAASVVPTPKPKPKPAPRASARRIAPPGPPASSSGDYEVNFDAHLGLQYWMPSEGDGDLEAVGGATWYFVDRDRFKIGIGADGNVGSDSSGWDLDARLNWQFADKHVFGVFGAFGRDERSHVDGYEVDGMSPDVDPAEWINAGAKWVWRVHDSPLDLGLKGRYIQEGTDMDVTLPDGRPADLVGYTGWQLDGGIYVPREKWLLGATVGYHDLDPNSGDYDPLDGVNAGVQAKWQFQPNLFGWRPKLQLNTDYLFAGEDMFQVGRIFFSNQTPLGPDADSMQYHLETDEQYIWTRKLFPGSLPTPVTPTPPGTTEPERPGPREPETPTEPVREGPREPETGGSTAPTSSGPNEPVTGGSTAPTVNGGRVPRT